MDASLIRTFGKDSIIFHEGDEGEEMFIIHAGQVRILRAIDGTFEELTMLGRGEFFGEMAVIDKADRSATAVAVEDDTKLIVVNTERFHKMLQDNVEIAIRMIRKYADRLKNSNAKIEQLMKDKHELDEGIQDILSTVKGRTVTGHATDNQIFGHLKLKTGELSFPLRAPVVLAGRKDTAIKFFPDLDLTDVDTQRTVSRRHVRLVYLDETAYVCEGEGVTNGTKVNGKQVPGNTLVPIFNGDQLVLGKVEFEFHSRKR